MPRIGDRVNIGGLPWLGPGSGPVFGATNQRPGTGTSSVSTFDRPGIPARRPHMSIGMGFQPTLGGPGPIRTMGPRNLGTTNRFSPGGTWTPPVSLPGGGGGGGNWFDPLVDRGVDWLSRRIFGGGGSGSGALPSEGSTAGSGCPQGYQFNPRTGRCEEIGFQGTMRRLLPGGETGTLEYGEAVVGAFGIPALQPAVVGQVQRKDGTVRPILRCPPGAVLGRDNLCYNKGSIPRDKRKWKPAPKPPMSAADAKALRRIGTLQKKVKRLASNAGLSCRKR